MVILDTTSNGYHELVLRMALEDEVLRRAVGVVAAQYLARERLQIRNAAEAERAAIISRLRKDSMSATADQVFNEYTWATLIVLLVGETVTGSGDHSFLVGMLLTLLANSRTKSEDPRLPLREHLRHDRVFLHVNLGLKATRLQRRFGCVLTLLAPFIFAVQQYLRSDQVWQYTGRYAKLPESLGKQRRQEVDLVFARNLQNFCYWERTMTSRDGCCWAPKDDLEAGVPSLRVVTPSSNIIIGAGYCGLTAARNASLEGLKVLRYQMEKDIESSFNSLKAVKHFEFNMYEGSTTMSHKDEIDSAVKKFTNVNGVYGRDTFPLLYDTFHNLKLILLDSGGTLKTTSFHELMHWWAMCGYTYQGLTDCLITWQFREGRLTFARRFFDEVVATKRLSYSLNTLIQHIKDTDLHSSLKFCALRGICIIPLNVLSSVSFDPPLPAGKQAAVGIGHVN
ncbi:hypothetical protein J1614_007173, partial [Plenodomus biglobosus]